MSMTDLAPERIAEINNSAQVFETLVNTEGAIVWTQVNKPKLPTTTLLYYEMFVEGAGLRAEVSDKVVNGTYLFRILNHPTIKFLHHAPDGEGLHMWADEGFHNALDNDAIGWEVAAKSAGVKPSDDPQSSN